MKPAIDDAMARRTLRAYARFASHALEDPTVWLGTDDDGDDEDSAGNGSPGAQSLLRRAGHVVRDRVSGATHPGSAGWSALPPGERTSWWVDRIGLVAAPIAAAPHLLGPVSDRIPMQAALSAAAQGLAVCAAASEHGVTDPEAWVPLLGKVLMGRDLAGDGAEETAVQPGDRLPDRSTGAHGVRDGARQLVKLARILLALRNAFDDRPRAARRYRFIGQAPIVGVVGGYLGERQTIHAAADATVELLAQGYPACSPRPRRRWLRSP